MNPNLIVRAALCTQEMAKGDTQPYCVDLPIIGIILQTALPLPSEQIDPPYEPKLEISQGTGPTT
jgi:hypothetical protein